VRERDGRDSEPSAGIVDPRSVRGASTVTSPTRGFDAAKKVSGCKTFGVVDALGLLVAAVVVAANVSDNADGCTCVDRARPKSGRLTKTWCDAGFKRAFARHCRRHWVKADVVSRTTAHRFEVLPRRWVVERTWAWLVNHRRLRIDYERDPGGVHRRAVTGDGERGSDRGPVAGRSVDPGGGATSAAPLKVHARGPSTSTCMVTPGDVRIRRIRQPCPHILTAHRPIRARSEVMT
jgi:transposase